MTITGKYGFIQEIDAVLRDLWINRHISPTAIKCSEGTLDEIADKIAQTANHQALICTVRSAETKPSYLNRYAAGAIPPRVEIVIDDNMAPGELMFLNKKAVLWP